jgi:hypothetical protein
MWFGGEEDGLVGSQYYAANLSQAEVNKIDVQAALFGGVAGEQYDPCYHEACDNIDTVTGQPPASTMNVFPTNPVLAQQQADSLNGNALKSLREMSGAVTHAVRYFARVKNALPPRPAATAARTKSRTRKAHTYRFKYLGHRRAPTR